jgi:hypothetical protein
MFLSADVQKKIGKPLLAKFEGLLFSLPYLWGLTGTPEPRHLFPTAGSPFYTQELDDERSYGDGHYKDRRTMLMDMLALLCRSKKTINFTGVYDSLLKARMQKMDVLRQGILIDRIREVRQYQEKILSRFKSAFDETYALLTTIDFLHAYPPTRAMDDILKSGLFNGPRGPFPFNETNYDDIPRRRPRAGHSPEPWLKGAHKELSAAGVTNVMDRKTFLEAVTLIPFTVPKPR